MIISSTSNNVVQDKEFYIKQKNFDKILAYAHHAKNKYQSEIGGMAVMVQDKDKDWQLLNPIILKQSISGGNCSLDKDSLAEYYLSLIHI